MNQLETANELVRIKFEMWRALLHSMNEFNGQINSLPLEQQASFFALHIDEFMCGFEKKHDYLIDDVNRLQNIFDSTSAQHKEAAL